MLHGGAAIAAIGFNRASKSVGARDGFIGWDHEQRKVLLKHAVNNVRFVILPTVQVKNLASHILSMSVRQMQKDWEERFGDKPFVAET